MYFSQWGNVTRCIIKVDRFTGNSRGFGFVTFENEESVNKVLSVPEHKLMGKRIDPKRAKPSREVMKKIFVGGIDPELSEESIKEYFSQFGQVRFYDTLICPRLNLLISLLIYKRRSENIIYLSVSLLRPLHAKP